MKNTTLTKKERLALMAALRAKYGAGNYKLGQRAGYQGEIISYASDEHRAANGGRMWLFGGYAHEVLQNGD